MTATVQNSVTLQSYIFVRFQQIPFKLGNILIEESAM